MAAAGIVLCGGKSSRMGRDKAWLPWRGQPMIAHVVSILRPIVDEVVVVASDALELPPLDARVVFDREPALGPLAGIREGLEQIRADFAFVTGTDAPFLSPAFVTALLACGSAAAPELDGYVQTLAAVYPRSALERIDAMLAAGRARPLRLLEELGYRKLSTQELPDPKSVRGFNTPDEYLEAVRESGGCTTATLEFQGRARLAMGCGELEVPIGTLGDLLAPFQPSIAVLDGDVIAKSFSISLNGRGLACSAAIPVGPGERICVLDAPRGVDGGRPATRWVSSLQSARLQGPHGSDGVMIQLTIDGVAVEVPDGTTIWDAARSAGIEIPALCHEPRFKPVGVCRICVVDVGERLLAASCVRTCEPAMEVQTATAEIESHRKTLTELLVCDQPPPERDPKDTTVGGNDLLALAARYEARRDRFPSGNARPADSSSPVIAVDHQACILCDCCIRACDDLQNNEVIGRTGKGYEARIAFDLDRPMGDSSCVSCGECVAACPTGALVDFPISAPLRPRTELTPIESVCPYCGVGCALTYHVDQNRNAIVFADGRESPGNQGRLCVKGRYGWDYVQHEQRLTVPLIRRDENYPKGAISRDVSGDQDGRRKPGGLVDYAEVLPAFREASWEEALDLVASRLAGIRDSHGPDSLAGFGSAKCSNEEAYLFQKLIRTAFGTNNVDHCTRLCHASSVAALLEGIGSGAVTTTYADIANAEAALIAGSNTTVNHPVAATFFKEASKRGTQLIVVDPRRPDIADHAAYYCRTKPGTDVAFYNAMMHVIIEEDLVDRAYVEQHTENYEALRETVEKYSPEQVAKVCGIPADTIREVAITFAKARTAIIFWGMGISQHTHGTDNARCLIALALLTGNIGKPGTGLHPLRGQNNVQGASDAGLVPMVYPDYQSVEAPEIREKFERAWGRSLSPKSGLTVVEITTGALEGSIRGMYIMGENPFLSDPNANKVRRALANLEFLVVQDIFLTETAEFADVILPASAFFEKEGTYTNTDRRVQIGRPALQPPGQARLDWKIICEISTRMGYPMDYDSTEQVFEEFAGLTSSYATLRHGNLGATGKLWPNPDPEHQDGPVVLFGDGFPTPNGRAKFVPAEWAAAQELPDAEYPLVLNTGRVLEHWHTGSMTRRAKALDAIEPEAFVGIHPDDARELGVEDGDRVRVTSPRGSIALRARIADREHKGAVFIPFHFREASANLLTTDTLDPDAKIPAFKFCAVRVERLSADAPSS